MHTHTQTCKCTHTQNIHTQTHTHTYTHTEFPIIQTAGVTFRKQLISSHSVKFQTKTKETPRNHLQAHKWWNVLLITSTAWHSFETQNIASKFAIVQNFNMLYYLQSDAYDRIIWFSNTIMISHNNIECQRSHSHMIDVKHKHWKENNNYIRLHSLTFVLVIVYFVLQHNNKCVSPCKAHW